MIGWVEGVKLILFVVCQEDGATGQLGSGIGIKGPL